MQEQLEVMKGKISTSLQDDKNGKKFGGAFLTALWKKMQECRYNLFHIRDQKRRKDTIMMDINEE